MTGGGVAGPWATGDGRVRQAGFTLLEVLVAFVIAALALAALTRGVAGGLLSARVAAHTQEALSRAQSHLAALAQPTPGETGGDDGGGFAWRLVVTPKATSARAPAGTPPPRARRAELFAVTVAISWRLDGGERVVALSTERVGAAPPDPP